MDLRIYMRVFAMSVHVIGGLCGLGADQSGASSQPTPRARCGGARWIRVHAYCERCGLCLRVPREMEWSGPRDDFCLNLTVDSYNISFGYCGCSDILGDGVQPGT